MRHTAADPGAPASPGTHRFAPVALNFAKMNGLVPFVLQHAFTQQILMVGFLNEEAWRKTCASGVLWLYRRTLGRLWSLGEDDGLHVAITRVRIDCDDDTVIFECVPPKPICGKGYHSCFYKELPAINFAHETP